MEYFERAEVSDPGNPIISIGLGKLGDREGAKKYLSIAKKKGYNPESLANVCRQLGLDPRRL